MKSIVKAIILMVTAHLIFARCSSPSSADNTVMTAEQVEVAIKALAKQVKAKTTFSDIVTYLRPFSATLNKVKRVNDFEFTAKYQPHLMLAIKDEQDQNPGTQLSKNFLKSIESYEDLHYLKFTLRNKKFKSELLRYDLESVQQYSERISYYSFYALQDAFIVENGVDTIRKGFVHFERTFDVSPEVNLTFVFESKHQSDLTDLVFVFDDRIFNNGKLSFDFDGQTISKLNAKEIKNLLL